MKFWEVFRFEVAYRLRRVSTWIYFGIMIAFAVTLAGSLVEGARGSGTVHANAPLSIALGMAAITMMSVAITAALFSYVALASFSR